MHTHCEHAAQQPEEQGPTDLELVKQQAALTRAAEVKRALAKARALRAKHIDREAFVREQRMADKLRRARGDSEDYTGAGVAEAMQAVGFEREVRTLTLIVLLLALLTGRTCARLLYLCINECACLRASHACSVQVLVCVCMRAYALLHCD
jgi:hypothetical protein